jgi:MFS family permease
MSSSSLIASVFTLGLALTAVPAGLLATKLGLRYSLFLGAALFSVCTAYVPIGFHMADLLVSRVLAGVGEGFYNVALYSFLAMLTTRYRGAMAGVVSTLFGLGMLTGVPVVTWIHRSTGDWHHPFYVLSAIGMVGAMALLFMIDKDQAATSKIGSAPILPRLARVISRRTLMSLLIAAVNGIGVYAFISITVTFLRTDRGLSQEVAAYVFSAYGLGSLLGGIPMGYLADRIGRRRFLIVAQILTGILGAAAFVVPPAIVPSVIVNFCLGVMFNGIFSNCYASIQDAVAKEDIPIATGLLATVFFFTASFSGWLIVQAAGFAGWEKGAMIVYTAPYWCCALLLFFFRSFGTSQSKENV